MYLFKNLRSGLASQVLLAENYICSIIMNDRLKELYKTVILKHNKEPYHFEKKEASTFVLKASNPVCGDRFQLFFEVENGVIEDIHFHGYGCAISKASTSVLAKKLEHKTIAEAKQLCKEFLNIIRLEEGKSESIQEEEFEAFSAARNFPGRMKCATLSWDEMVLFLAK